MKRMKDYQDGVTVSYKILPNIGSLDLNGCLCWAKASDTEFKNIRPLSNPYIAARTTAEQLEEAKDHPSYVETTPLSVSYSTRDEPEETQFASSEYVFMVDSASFNVRNGGTKTVYGTFLDLSGKDPVFSRKIDIDIYGSDDARAIADLIIAHGGRRVEIDEDPYIILPKNAVTYPYKGDSTAFSIDWKKALGDTVRLPNSVLDLATKDGSYVIPVIPIKEYQLGKLD